MHGLRAARLFDGIADEPVPDALVLIEDGVVHEVRSGGRGGTDLGDVTLLPGLVDAHLHLSFDGGPRLVEDLRGLDDAALLDRARAAARASLAAGITTARDLGSRGYGLLSLRDELARDPGAGPHLLVSGPPITPAGGHLWFLDRADPGAEDLTAAVRVRAGHRVDVIKVCASGGDLTPGSRSGRSQYTVDELRTVVEAAHGLGLPVAAHAHGTESIARAVAAAVDTIEHATFLDPDGEPEPVRPEELAASGIPVCVTGTGVRDPAGLSTRDAERLAAVRTGIRRLHAAGVALVCGSDAGVSHRKRHPLLPYSLAGLAGTGLSAAAALRTVTSHAARACGVFPAKGVIAPGADADLLAIAGDPRRDLATIHAVVAVYRAGRQVHP
jgi:imidazolonepropionase-like amidohydrolase